MSDTKEIKTKEQDNYDDELDEDFEDTLSKKSPSEIKKTLDSFENPEELGSAPSFDMKELEKLKKKMSGMSKTQLGAMLANMLKSSSLDSKENLSSVSSDHRSDVAKRLHEAIALKKLNRKKK